MRNGRNYKDNIIKLSLNSFSTNTAINNDNLSANNSKKLKNFKNVGFTEENYPPFKQINCCNKKSVFNNINTNKEYIKNSKNVINSQNNKIIFVSSYSSKINNSNKKHIIKNNISQKLNNNNKEYNNTKTIFTQIDKNKHKIINNNHSNNINKNNINKEKLYDILDKFNYKNDNNNNINRKLNIDSKYSVENTNEKKSSIKSSKFINFDLINENESIFDGIELTNYFIKNVENKNNNNYNNLKDGFYEIEFEDYIKKLNLEEVNIDRELFERPLFYNRSKKINSKPNTNKLKNYFKTSNCDSNFLSKKIKKNKCNKSIYINNIKKNLLRNSLKENNGTKSKEKKLNKKNNLINESNKQNKDKYKIKEKINKIKNFSLNSDNKSKRIFDLYKKQDKIGLSNSNSKLLISNNLYNINYTNKEINKNNNSSKKEDMHKDYFNFKKIIKNNFNNINNFQITDFLLTSKQGLPKKNPYINFQKSVNISLKKINSDVSSRNDSPKKNKKLHLQGRNDILSKYVKSNFNSTNISKVNNIYTTWNSFENNISSNNIIEEEINKKNYKIIKIFKNKKNLDENVCSDKNKDKKLTNNDSKIFNNKIYNNSIIKIKCALINKRNGSSNNILHIKNFKNKIILNNNNHDKNIKCNLLKNTNHYESIKRMK